MRDILGTDETDQITLTLSGTTNERDEKESKPVTIHALAIILTMGMISNIFKSRKVTNSLLKMTVVILLTTIVLTK